MPSRTFGVISPHPPIFVPGVGGREAHVAQASLDALETARLALDEFAPETLVLMSPHAPAASDAFVIETGERVAGSLGQFGDADAYSWPGDPAFARALLERLAAEGIPAVARGDDTRLRPGWLDHATIVPLHFLDPSMARRLVIISLSYLPYEMHRRVGAVVADTVDDLGRSTAFIASGDLSHRLKPGAPAGYSPRAADLDEAIVSRVRAGRLGDLMTIDEDLVSEGGECGLRSLITLGGFSGTDPVPTRVLAYEGPWGVGYLTALVGEAAIAASNVAATAKAGRKGGMPGADRSEIVSLARRAIEAYVTRGETQMPGPLKDAEYPAQAGAFVSLHRGGMLRGCIGTILPTRDTLAEEVARNAIEAATADPRFPALSADELGDLDVKVDVLHAPESCRLDDLDPSRYGVIVSSGWRRGLLLPDLEGVDDVATQVSIAMQKAGIASIDGCQVERFKVDRYT